MIKVWKRSTLEHYQTLSGHEGPVNAVGLQGERVVSAGLIISKLSLLTSIFNLRSALVGTAR